MDRMDDRIIRQVLRVLNRAIFTERKRVFRVDDVSLYPSEAHLLFAIADDPNANSTRIAREAGLTKGAVSQTLTRLERKGVISKQKNPLNQSELTLELTAFGKKALRQCQKVRSSLTTAHEAYLARLRPKEKELVLGFLRHMESALTDLP